MKLILALYLALLLAPLTALHAAEVRVFFETHCFDCHDSETKKGNLDLTALKPDFGDAETFARWVNVHDRIASGEMPPKKEPRPRPHEGRHAWLPRPYLCGRTQA